MKIRRRKNIILLFTMLLLQAAAVYVSAQDNKSEDNNSGVSEHVAYIHTGVWVSNGSYRITYHAKTDSGQVNMQVTFLFDKYKFKERKKHNYIRYKKKYKQLYLDKYGEIFLDVADWIYTKTDLLDKNQRITYFIKNDVEKPDLSYYEGHYGVTMNETYITAENMISLFQEIYK